MNKANTIFALLALSAATAFAECPPSANRVPVDVAIDVATDTLGDSIYDVPIRIVETRIHEESGAHILANTRFENDAAAQVFAAGKAYWIVTFRVESRSTNEPLKPVVFVVRVILDGESMQVID